MPSTFLWPNLLFCMRAADHPLFGRFLETFFQCFRIFQHVESDPDGRFDRPDLSPFCAACFRKNYVPAAAGKSPGFDNRISAAQAKDGVVPPIVATARTNRFRPPPAVL